MGVGGREEGSFQQKITQYPREEKLPSHGSCLLQYAILMDVQSILTLA